MSYIVNNSKINESIFGVVSPSNTIYVSKLGDDTFGDGSFGKPYLTIKKGVDEANSIATIMNPILVSVGAGKYTEDPTALSSYVSISGLEQDRVIIIPSDVNTPLYSMTFNTMISFIRIEDVTNSYAILCDDIGDLGILHKVYISNCYGGVKVLSTSGDSYMYLEYVSIDNPSYIGIESTSSGNTTEVSCENTYIYEIDSLSAVCGVLSDGGDTKVIFHSGGVVNQFSIGNGSGFVSANGGSFRLRNIQIEGYLYGILTNSGVSPNIAISSVSFDNNTNNFYINNSTASGYFNGYSEFDKYYINPSSTFFVSNTDNNTITVSKKGGDFDNIIDALASITDNSSTRRYTIKLGIGVFVSDTITLKPYVDIVGISYTSSIIEVDNVNKNLIVASANSGLFNLQLRGATGTGFSAIVYNGGLGVFRCVEVRFGANYRFYLQNSTTNNAISLFQNISAENTSNFTTAFEVTDNGVNSSTMAFNGFTYIGNGSTLFKIYGTLTALSSANYTVSKTVGGGNGIHFYNGATVAVNAVTLTGFNNAVYNENTGGGGTIYTGAFSIRECVTDIRLDNPNTTGSIFGFFDKNKIIIEENISISLLFTDNNGQGTLSLGSLWLGNTYNTVFNASDLLTSGNMGLHDGGEITLDTGTTIDITEGHGYLGDYTGPEEVYKRLEWTATGLTLPVSSDVYVYFNENGILSYNATRPSSVSNVILGRVVTNATEVEFIDANPNGGEHLANKISDSLRDVFGALYVSGSLTTSNSSRQLEVSNGVFYLAENYFTPSGKTFTDNFTPIYKSSISGEWLSETPTNIVNNTKYDDGTGTLANTTASYYVKHNLFLVKDGIEKYYLLYGQDEYSTFNDAENSPNPTKPSFFKDSVVLVASMVVQQGNATLCTVRDERPIPISRGSSSSGVTNHGDLSGLSSDDHTQYLLANGGRNMSGNLNMGGNQITNVGNVDGVDISAHASRHLPNGSDPLTTSSAVSISRLTSNGTGIANTLARADHTHKVLEEVATIITTSGIETTLTDSSNARIIYDGSAFGESLKLGDATSYTNGKIIKVVNSSLQTISIVNNSSTELFRCEPSNSTECILKSNATSDGVWNFINTKPKYDSMMEFMEDFISPTTAGQTLWTSTVNGGGTVIAVLAGLVNSIGVVSNSTGTSNSGRATLHKGGQSFLLGTGNGVTVIESRIQFSVLSTVAQEYIAYIGLGDNTGAGDMVDGVYFEYNRLASGDVWRLKTSSNSVRTTTATATAIASSTWYKLKIEINYDSTRADFFVNDVNIGNITTNIPTGTGRNTDLLFKIEKSAGGTPALLYTDYSYIRAYLNR